MFVQPPPFGGIPSGWFGPRWNDKIKHPYHIAKDFLSFVRWDLLRLPKVACRTILVGRLRLKSPQRNMERSNVLKSTPWKHIKKSYEMFSCFWSKPLDSGCFLSVTIRKIRAPWQALGKNVDHLTSHVHNKHLGRVWLMLTHSYSWAWEMKTWDVGHGSHDYFLKQGVLWNRCWGLGKFEL